MNAPFLDDDFLLQNKFAVELYHGFAEPMPIIDYHCHLPPRQIAEDCQFENLTQIWLAGDHYKWRAMRACGVSEHCITGGASDWEKFQKWAETTPKTLRNPLYHWTHLELKKPFGIRDRLLNATTAQGIWKECNSQLATPACSVRGLLKQWNVEVVCTTDDPTDSLEYHKKIAGERGFGTKVFPAFRPDMALAVETPESMNPWLDKLATAAQTEVDDFAGLIAALRKRGEFFHANGCRLSDHGIEQPYAADYTDQEVDAAFKKARQGQSLRPDELVKFKSAVLYELGLFYHEKGWTQQFHLGALRNVNTRTLKTLGKDTGADTIGDFEIARPLARFLDRLDSNDKLARTILYNVNPCDNEVLATMIGNFQDGRTPGKMQFGSAWWFMDQKDGMERQLEALSNMGLLSLFVGMLTDSRSFLSYSRHEYFRRLLCNLLGSEVEEGLLPRDLDLLGQMVRDICYRNAAGYFGFGAKTAGNER
jgi:glucuronate isomerase